MKRKTREDMTKDKLIEIIKGLMQTTRDLGFLLRMDQIGLQTLAP